MAKKNKVNKQSFTELFLVSKKTYNLLNNKRKTIIKGISNPTYVQYPQTQYHSHHYPVHIPLQNGNVNGGSNENKENVNMKNDNNISTLEDLSEENEDIPEDILQQNDGDERENILFDDYNHENEQETTDSEQVDDYTHENEQETMDGEREETFSIPFEKIQIPIHTDVKKRSNLDYINQQKRASFLKTKKHKLFENIGKQVMYDIINNKRINNREKKIYEARKKTHKTFTFDNNILIPNTVLKPPINTNNSINEVNNNNNNIMYNQRQSSNIQPQSALTYNLRTPQSNQPIENILLHNQSNNIQKNPYSTTSYVSLSPSRLENIVSHLPQSREKNKNLNTTQSNIIVEAMETSPSKTLSRRRKFTTDDNSNPTFSHYTPKNDTRKKIHKKAKVIIIDEKEEKSPNSEMVDRILQSNVNDPYDVFQFSKNARITYTGLKRKFNAFSKKLHPDKESSPGAHEAFIIMRRAFIQLKKEIQIRDELEKEKRSTQKKQSSPQQNGYGIKKWIKLCK